jgi:hypothetical protein
MEWQGILFWTAVAIAGAFACSVLARVVWRLRSELQIRKAGPRRLSSSRHRIWRDPGPPTAETMRFGPGGREGAPRPPFRFVEEHLTGSQPCVAVRDAANRLWRVKWGHEVRPESFAVRMAHALGYFAEVTHYLEDGLIDGAENLTRAKNCIDPDCRFREARFELEDPDVRMHFNEHSWSWDDNPFVGTPQLSGLKLLVMLVSNWDTKDRRDVARGSNTAIFEHRVSRWAREARYLITDWGGAMGKWGTNVVSRGRWDPDGFETQTPQFVTGVREDGIVTFGYVGQRTGDVAYDIPVDHVRWFYELASRLTEDHLREGLRASGADEEEANRFARAILQRIAQLGRCQVSGDGYKVSGDGFQDGASRSVLTPVS